MCNDCGRNYIPLSSPQVSATGKTREGGEGLAAWLTLLQAQSVVVDGLESDLDIPLGWFEVLIQLTSAPEGRLKMQELAHSVLLSKSGLTRLVDRMAEAGLVTRAPCPTDRRAIYANVTPAGRAALRKTLPTHNESLAEHFSNVLTKSELVALRATLDKILDAANFNPPPCPTNLPDGASARARVVSKV
jgi:DNA-binding MarR family transcriptional regulator